MTEPTLDRELYPALWRQLGWYLTAPERVLSLDERAVRAEVLRLLAARDEARAERDRLQNAANEVVERLSREAALFREVRGQIAGGDLSGAADALRASLSEGET